MAFHQKNEARILLRACAVAAWSLLAVTPMLPQSTGAPERQKIGLVLEGGGALGLAHIGVITWLEEHHIPVSYVAGTSMGGLVGGVYATGRNPKEVRDLVESIEWNKVLRGVIPFQNLTFRRKEDAYQFPGGIEFGLKKGVDFPGGFNSGQEVSFILDRVALPYSTITSFDQMPIPFACVGTDLVASKQYVFRSGSLAQALRSTMSLPGVFTPVRADGHIFADGGLLDNLPVDVAKQMGADIVVAVYLDSAPMGPDVQLSSFGVLGRSISVMIAANEVHSLEMADLLISVPVAKYNTMDYAQSSDLIAAGYAAAEGKAKVLEKFSVDDAGWQKYIAERTARRRQAPQPEFVEVEGTDHNSAKAIQKELEPVVVHKPVDIAAIQEQIQDVQGDGRYSSLNYSMTEKDGKPGLLVKTEEKSYAPPIVRPVVDIDGSNSNNVLFSIGARITALNVGTYGAEWRNDVVFGSSYGITSEYFRPLGAFSRWYIAPRATAQSSEFNAYTSSGSLGSIYRQKQFGGGADIAYEMGRSNEFRLGYQAAYFKYVLQVGEVTEPEVSGQQAFTQFKYTLLHVNDPVVPTQGELALFSTRWFNSSPDSIKVPGGPTIAANSTQHFPATDGRYTGYFRLSPRDSIFFGGGGGTVYHTTNISLPIYQLGGPTVFAAYGNQEILTNQYGFGQAGYLRRLVQLPPLLGSDLYFQARLEIGTFQEVGTAAGETAQYRVPADGSGAIIINTIFGPILLGGAIGDAGHYRLYFGLGKIF